VLKFHQKKFGVKISPTIIKLWHFQKTYASFNQFSKKAQFFEKYHI